MIDISVVKKNGREAIAKIEEMVAAGDITIEQLLDYTKKISEAAINDMEYMQNEILRLNELVAKENDAK